MNPEFNEKISEILDLHDEDTFEKIASEVLSQIEKDENPLSQLGKNLCSIYEEESYILDRILTVFCGWNFKHLLILANVIEDDEGILLD